MNRLLWTPTKQQRDASQMMHFARSIADQYGIPDDDYEALHRWSIAHREEFWAEIWEVCGVIHSRRYQAVLGRDALPGAEWFPGSRLNFAENLLRFRDEHPALVSLREDGSRRSISYHELFRQVAALAAALRAQGITAGDTIAGFLPNIPEAAIAMLATTSIGAIWSSCSPDFGSHGVMDRFGQIAPRILFTADGYTYNGKSIDALQRVADICARITTIEQVVVIPYLDAKPDTRSLANAVHYEDFIDLSAHTITFEQLPFDHPLYILYSSGTTGAPKCIVHGAGGTLLQHLKEHRLHTDIDRSDVFFYFTTCGWMMWNWLISGLASGCTLVLYDGSPLARNGRRLLDAIDEEEITVFGVSAKYLASLQQAGLTPRTSHRLDSLHTLLCTGSPLSQNSFEYVYREIKAQLCLASISGGTDIISTFVLGNPALPVRSGEIQCRGLGMAVEVWDDSARPVIGRKGELVCTQSFPSSPVMFWNDADGSKYQRAYFERFAGVWAQGDWAELTQHGGIVIYGRSDAVLNPAGVRIGTAEIYREVERMTQVLDSVVIGQQWQDDVRVVLFVVLRPDLSLDDRLKQVISDRIRAGATPRHVPAKIIQVNDIPRTISGKIVELAVRDVVHGHAIQNTDALANPEALLQFQQLEELQKA